MDIEAMDREFTAISLRCKSLLQPSLLGVRIPPTAVYFGPQMSWIIGLPKDDPVRLILELFVFWELCLNFVLAYHDHYKNHRYFIFDKKVVELIRSSGIDKVEVPMTHHSIKQTIALMEDSGGFGRQYPDAAITLTTVLPGFEDTKMFILDKDYQLVTDVQKDSKYIFHVSHKGQYQTLKVENVFCKKSGVILVDQKAFTPKEDLKHEVQPKNEVKVEDDRSAPPEHATRKQHVPRPNKFNKRHDTRQRFDDRRDAYGSANHQSDRNRRGHARNDYNSSRRDVRLNEGDRQFRNDYQGSNAYRVRRDDKERRDGYRRFPNRPQEEKRSDVSRENGRYREDERRQREEQQRELRELRLFKENSLKKKQEDAERESASKKTETNQKARKLSGKVKSYAYSSSEYESESSSSEDVKPKRKRWSKKSSKTSRKKSKKGAKEENNLTVETLLQDAAVLWQRLHALGVVPSPGSAAAGPSVPPFQQQPTLPVYVSMYGHGGFPSFPYSNHPGLVPLPAQLQYPPSHNPLLAHAVHVAPDASHMAAGLLGHSGITPMSSVPSAVSLPASSALYYQQSLLHGAAAAHDASAANPNLGLHHASAALRSPAVHPGVTAHHGRSSLLAGVAHLPPATPSYLAPPPTAHVGAPLTYGPQAHVPAEINKQQGYGPPSTVTPRQSLATQVMAPLTPAGDAAANRTQAATVAGLPTAATIAAQHSHQVQATQAHLMQAAAFPPATQLAVPSPHISLTDAQVPNAAAHHGALQ